MDDGLRAALALANKLRQNKLLDGFTARDVRRNQWRSLTTDESVEAAIGWLEDEGWLRATQVSSTGPGRRTNRYFVNPKIRRTTKGCTTNTAENSNSSVLAVACLGSSGNLEEYGEWQIGLSGRRQFSGKPLSPNIQLGRMPHAQQRKALTPHCQYSRNRPPRFVTMAIVGRRRVSLPSGASASRMPGCSRFWAARYGLRAAQARYASLRGPRNRSARSRPGQVRRFLARRNKGHRHQR